MGKKAEYILDKYVVNHNTQRKAAIYSQIHTFAYLESPVKLTCISLDCGRQPEHAGTARRYRENMQIPLNGPSSCYTSIATRVHG